ncbi:transmembrane and immunoglobulin domain-containing protein 1 [Maylandia zebra]|uniref:Ig-like domain-containing protein n=1 Tax=Astatotilapia calliptera TaxID=8154 RepID=A0A3P8QTW9_ASTCA|nr:transmembrane and immunoglobulin domain-containing protein 1 [Maylandia zebra]XP_004550051.1 transmembrane and immunoglobulin domain-containing protein 1 [Maylandia zebra]XP_004550052.1 transmembrane and immunoglobulin domain-containing protein 1 [Maylandia zebra]XP_004550053.1 transmembrane and immunoglobulin domain-containing protein 1 [Maylandia zebra]XP_026037541.1 transmembrane and immunoglobulin domain-containing protein 1-like [Astatotilapia calliptera]XP_026037542.1 transmembrane an
MKFILRAAVFHFLVLYAVHVLGINIQSKPAFNDEGVIQVKLNDPVSLVCTLGVTKAEEELVWLRNDAAVLLKEGNNKNRSSLCVTPTYEDNGAKFTCHQKGNSTDQVSVTLNVTFAPNISETVEVTVEEEDDLVLECDTRANPLVSSVTWSLNGSLVDLLADGLSVINNGLTSQLTSSKVKKTLHGGMYTCTVDSPMYGSSSRHFQVTITDKTLKFPLGPMIAGLVVVGLTALLAVVSRWRKIVKCCK